MVGARAEDISRLTKIPWIPLRWYQGGLNMGAWGLLIQDLCVESRKTWGQGNEVSETVSRKTQWAQESPVDRVGRPGARSLRRTLVPENR